MKILVRRLEGKDVETALKLAWEVFIEFNGPGYCQKGIEEFKRFLDVEEVRKKIEKREFILWGCFADGLLVGILATRMISHISLFFVKKEYQNKGIGKVLFKEAMNCCEQVGFEKMTTNAAPYGVEIYRHMGFVELDKELEVNGIRFVPMVYYIPFGD